MLAVLQVAFGLRVGTAHGGGCIRVGTCHRLRSAASGRRSVMPCNARGLKRFDNDEVCRAFLRELIAMTGGRSSPPTSTRDGA